jgi:hypothetical protein
MKGLYIKVPEGMLALWKSEAERRGITLSLLIREAVNKDIARES